MVCNNHSNFYDIDYYRPSTIIMYHVLFLHIYVTTILPPHFPLPNWLTDSDTTSEGPKENLQKGPTGEQAKVHATSGREAWDPTPLLDKRRKTEATFSTGGHSVVLILRRIKHKMRRSTETLAPKRERVAWRTLLRQFPRTQPGLVGWLIPLWSSQA